MMAVYVTWIENNEYSAVNSENNIQSRIKGMRRKEKHGIFVGDIMMTHIHGKHLIDECFEKYPQDFEYTGGHHLESFMGLDVKQTKSKISLYLDAYIRETMNI